MRTSLAFLCLGAAIACGCRTGSRPASEVQPATIAPPPPDVAAPTGDAPASLVVEADYELPARGPVTACRAATAPAKPSAKRRTYEFSRIELVPLPRGPVIADRPYVGFPLLLMHLHEAFSFFADDAAACWKWASARGAAPTSRELDVEITASGRLRDLRVAGPDDELTSCLRDVLTTESGQVQHHSPLPTHVRATLEFRLEDEYQHPWRKKPRRPRTKTRAAKASTADACASGALVERVIPYPLVVTDWDPSRTPKSAPLRWMGGCVTHRSDPDKIQIRVAVESNRGALQACYADALKRQPDLRGELNVSTVFEIDGRASQTQVTGAGDDALHVCVSRAVDALWLDPSVGDASALDTRFTFVLAPAPAPSPLPAGSDPNALLDAGDVDGALAALVQKLRTPHTALEGCRAHAAIVRAMMLAAPWLDDPRVQGAIGELGRSARALPVTDGRSCVGVLEPLLKTYVRVGGAPPDELDRPIRQLERLDAMLQLAPLLDWGVYLRWARAALLQSTPRSSEAESELTELARDPEIGAAVTAWLAARRTSSTIRTCVR